MDKAKKEALWKDAKTKCRLNEETIRMAKEMGLNPWSLIKNIPSDNERWKAPVHVWIQDMYGNRREKAQAKALAKKRATEQE